MKMKVRSNPKAYCTIRNSTRWFNAVLKMVSGMTKSLDDAMDDVYAAQSKNDPTIKDFLCMVMAKVFAETAHPNSNALLAALDVLKIWKDFVPDYKDDDDDQGNGSGRGPQPMKA